MALGWWYLTSSTTWMRLRLLAWRWSAEWGVPRHLPLQILNHILTLNFTCHYIIAALLLQLTNHILDIKTEQQRAWSQQCELFVNMQTHIRENIISWPTLSVRCKPGEKYKIWVRHCLCCRGFLDISLLLYWSARKCAPGTLSIRNNSKHGYIFVPMILKFTGIHLGPGSHCTSTTLTKA
jgi:hypothetical protein